MGRAERIGREAASLILGIPGRTVLKLASEGVLDEAGATKDIGRGWTFNEARLRAWVSKKEQESCARNGKRRPAATGVKARSGLVSPSKVSKSDEAYQQAMSGLLRPAPRS